VSRRYWAVVPAAGVGRRMGASLPKQYLPLSGQRVIDHTLARLLDPPLVQGLFVAVADQDPWWSSSLYASHPRVTRVTGGSERSDSVLRALDALAGVADPKDWVLVHDAARPCVRRTDIERLIGQGATVDMIATAARQNGMLSLFESGLRHVLEGDSSVDELLRVTDIPMEGRYGPAGARQAALGIPSLYPTGVFPAVPQGQEAPAAPAVDLTTAFELLEEAAPPVEVPAGDQSRGVSVLLVDDEDQLRRVMKDLLERDGYLVHEARDGVQALDQVDRVAPDIIVLDLNLPGLDGYGVLAKLRSRPTTQDIPVIVLTAKGDEDNEVRVFELGADDFLTKPFRARALSARLDAVLSRRRAG